MNLTDKIFHDDEAARLHLEAQRWPDGPYCPFCGAFDGVRRMTGASTKPGTCHCKACRKKFSVTVGTVFESSHIGLAKWMLAFRLMASSKKGVSALQIERTLGVTYKTAWFMAHRIREAMKVESPAPIGGEGKVIEVDETYVGGKESNKHARKRLPADLARDAKKAVVTLVERGGEARSFHVANVTSKTLRTVTRIEFLKRTTDQKLSVRRLEVDKTSMAKRASDLTELVRHLQNELGIRKSTLRAYEKMLRNLANKSPTSPKAPSS